MLKGSMETPWMTPLPDLGAVRVQGADAVRFLQGQLSNDVALLAAESLLLAGLHNPQGRVIAVLRLMAVGQDDVLAVLPRELAAPVALRLSKYVLRAKAKVTDASADWAFTGVAARDPPASSSLAARVSNGMDRWLIANPSAGAGAPESDADDRAKWRALDVAGGIPEVYAATSEQFVAQMLNLDVLGVISFTKGCYTGQEVIARAHYRGRVKRRMQRFRTADRMQLAVGESGKFRDGRSFRVVEVATLPDGRCEFLAVAPMAQGGEEEPGEAPTDAAATTSLDAEQLTMPYELPA
jgi:folate-binding protein YgfZ